MKGAALDFEIAVNRVQNVAQRKTCGGLCRIALQSQGLGAGQSTSNPQKAHGGGNPIDPNSSKSQGNFHLWDFTVSTASSLGRFR
jgi:hypothetical protein